MTIATIAQSESFAEQAIGGRVGNASPARGLKLNSVVRSAAQAVHTATSNSHVRLDMAFVWMSFVWEAEDYL